MTTHDGVTGFWDPDAGHTQRPVKSRPEGYGDLSYLNPNRRMAMLYAALSSHFCVSGPLNVSNRSLVKLNVGGSKMVFSTTPPGTEYFKAQLRWVRNYADLREDRGAEILVQIDDILSFFGAIGRLDATQKKYSLEILTVVQKLAYDIALQVKHYAWAPRPSDYSPYIMPMIQTPDHSTFPSGHAVEAFALATILQALGSATPKDPADTLTEIKDWAIPFRVAHRIAVNRTIAGVHFPVDSAAGAMLGIAIGEAVIGLAISRRNIRCVPFKLKNFQKTDDFTTDWLRGLADKFGDLDIDISSDKFAGRYWSLAQKEW